MILRKALFLIVIITGLCMNAAFAAAGSSLPSDVGANHWIAASVSTAVQDGWLSVKTGEGFRPDAPADRLFIAELIAGAWPIAEKQGRAQGSFPEVDGVSGYFKDINDLDTEVELIINRLAAAGIMKGYPGELFSPQRTVSRIEMVAILSRVSKGGNISVPHFADGSQIPSWGLVELNKAASAGLVGGYDDGTFRPLQTVTRAEALQMVSRWVYVQNVVPVVSRGQNSSVVDPIASDILRRVNVERSNRGLGILRVNALLTQIACEKASSMANDNYYSHTSPNGEDTRALFSRYGIVNKLIGENMLRMRGNVTAEKAVAAWMQSEHHRNIILTAFEDTGVAFARAEDGTVYIVQEFAALQ